MRLSLSILVFILAASNPVEAQSWQPPADTDRCPSQWGAGDQRGSGNHMSARTVLRATGLIRTGTVVELSHVLSDTMPFFGTRKFEITTKRTFMNPGTNRRGSNEEMIHGEMGQIGSQFDAFSHQTIGDSLYNCFRLDDIATRSGFTKLGVENVGTLMTRGVIIDVAAVRNASPLAANHEITPADLQAALREQNITLEKGDAILIRTGWSRYWGTDNTRYGNASPGIGVAAAQWLARQDPMLIGADNPSVEISPNPDPKLSLPVHQILLAVNGIHLLENLKLEELAAKKVYEFAFVIQPLRMKGATGSTVAPVAIY